MATKDICMSVYQAFACLVVIAIVCCSPVTSKPKPSLAGMGESDFIEAWHNHCHTRCGGQLTPMVNTACNLDPYDQTRRAKRTVEGGKQDLMSRIEAPFLDKPFSAMFLTKRVRRGHSISRRGIVEECCHKACTWEEYAEYCWLHPRSEHSRSQQTHCIK